MPKNKMKTQLVEDLRLLPESYSVHVLLDRREFREEDRPKLAEAIKEVVHAMKMQNIGHYPLEFAVHNARVSIRKYLSVHGERITVDNGK